jgi:hypothetical protein
MGYKDGRVFPFFLGRCTDVSDASDLVLVIVHPRIGIVTVLVLHFDYTTHISEDVIYLCLTCGLRVGR